MPRATAVLTASGQAAAGQRMQATGSRQAVAGMAAGVAAGVGLAGPGAVRDATGAVGGL